MIIHKTNTETQHPPRLGIANCGIGHPLEKGETPRKIKFLQSAIFQPLPPIPGLLVLERSIAHRKAREQRLPAWLEWPFFQRLKPEEKQHIADQTADIEVTREQISSLKSREFNTDSFYKQPDWIYIALKAFSLGYLDDFEIADLVLYDSSRNVDSFKCYFGKEKVMEILRLALKYNDKKKTNISVVKPDELVLNDVPDEDLHVFSYVQSLFNPENDNSEERLAKGVLFQFIPVILNSDKTSLPLIVPPRLLRFILVHVFGYEHAITPFPVLGYSKEENLTNPYRRVMSILHPAFAVLEKSVLIHDFENFDPTRQTIYFHDLYHLFVLSAIHVRVRKLVILLALTWMQKDQCPIRNMREKEEIIEFLLDQDFKKYLNGYTQYDDILKTISDPREQILELFYPVIVHLERKIREQKFSRSENFSPKNFQEITEYIEKFIETNESLYEAVRKPSSADLSVL